MTAARIALRRDGTRPGAATADSETLDRAIEALIPRERLALALHHRARLNSHEMARALGCSPAAATATLREAHRRLGVEPDDDDDIPEVDLDDDG